MARIHETAFRPWQSDNIPRRYCSARRHGQRRQAAPRCTTRSSRTADLPASARASNGASPGWTATGPIIPPAGPPSRKPDFRHFRLYRAPGRICGPSIFVLEMFRRLLGFRRSSQGRYEGRHHVSSFRELDLGGAFIRHCCCWPLIGAGTGIGAGPPAEHPRRVRFLRAVAVLVALVLRGSAGARQRRALAAGAMRRPAVLLRGARAVAAI